MAGDPQQPPDSPADPASSPPDGLRRSKVRALLEEGQQHRREGRLKAAISAHEAMVALAPKNPHAWSELALSYQQGGSLQAALEGYRQAVRLAPENPELHYNLGTALQRARLLPQAHQSLVRTLRARPGHARAAANLGLVYQAMGRLQAAERALRYSVQLEPSSALNRWNLAQNLLMAGNHPEGWGFYEARHELPDFSMPPIEGPRWDGVQTDGLSLLVQAEQGLGDTFQFVRFLQHIRPGLKRLILRCQPPLVSMLEPLDAADQVCSMRDPIPPFDAWIGLLSLPHILGVTRNRLWPGQPYLRAEPQLEAHWSERLAKRPGFRIGICWQGNPTYGADSERSIPLRAFLPLTRVPGVTLFSIQKMHGLDQLERLGPAAGIVDLGRELDETTAPFMDTAAVMRSLDLIVSSDTSITHLAGGLGVEIWVGLAQIPDWRFELRGQDCPWYPSMRLFRQQRAGDWADVFARIARALEQRLTTQPS